MPARRLIIAASDAVDATCSFNAGMVVAGCGLLGVVFLLSFKALGKLFDDVELILYGIGVMVLSCLLMIRGIWSPLIGNDDVDTYAIWLTAMVSMYGVGPTRCDK